MIIKKVKKNKGFVLLYAVMLSSILLAITVGVMEISYSEIKFGTSAKDTNDAFFAADTGAECALYYDKVSPNLFPVAGGATEIMCANSSITPTYSSGSGSGFYSFIIKNLGGESLISDRKGCAVVTVFKTESSGQIISKGYNNNGVNCDTSNASTVERQLILNYTIAN